MISANHGRGVEGAAQFLTLENDVALALEGSRLGRAERLPAHFQWLLRVQMVDFDEEVISVERISHRIFASPQSSKPGDPLGNDADQELAALNPDLLRGSKSLP